MNDATRSYADDPKVRQALDALYRAMLEAADTDRPGPRRTCPVCGDRLVHGRCPNEPRGTTTYITK